jgi:arylsulfatase A-like enzyme
MRGKTLHGMVHLADWFPTIANLAGLRNAVPMKTKGEADGMDVWPYLSGEHKLSPRTEVVLSTVSKKTGSVDALISHNWKLVLGHPLCDCFSSRTYPDANSTTGPDALNCNPDHNAPGGVGGETWLFDMEKDPEERKNVAPLFAHKVAELTEILNQRRTSEMKYSDPDSWAPDVEEKCKAYVRSHRGFLGPFFD